MSREKLKIKNLKIIKDNNKLLASESVLSESTIDVFIVTFIARWHN